MLQYRQNMEASCIIYVKVGMLSYLEQSKTCLSTVNKMEIVRLAVLHVFIDSISFMYYADDNVRQTSADVLSLAQCPTYS